MFFFNLKLHKRVQNCCIHFGESRWIHFVENLQIDVNILIAEQETGVTQRRVLS